MALTKAQARRLKALPAEGGNRVKAARQLAGLTQLGMAADIGLRQTYISAVERGDIGSVTVDSARKFSEFFGVDIETLFPATEAEVTR